MLPGKNAGVDTYDAAAVDTPPISTPEHRRRNTTVAAAEPSFVRPSDLLRPRHDSKIERKIDRDEREALVCASPALSISVT